MMDGDKAVVAVIDVIKALTLPDFDGDAVHKYDPPEEVSGEYIAVDHLPFVFDSPLENGIVNINVHVPRLTNGRIPSARLYALWHPIKEVFEESDEQPYGKYLDGAYFLSRSHSRPTLDGDNTYYVNIQLTVTFNNLK